MSASMTVSYMRRDSRRNELEKSEARFGEMSRRNEPAGVPTSVL